METTWGNRRPAADDGIVIGEEMAVAEVGRVAFTSSREDAGGEVMVGAIALSSICHSKKLTLSIHLHFLVRVCHVLVARVALPADQAHHPQ
jgi:hypothetical protein